MSNSKIPSLLERHWAESALAIGAVVIAAVSLWVGYDTLRTNGELVAAASWPFLEQYNSDATYTGQRLASIDVVNDGIGPAKVESVQVFWHGKAYRSSAELLRDCCGFEPGVGAHSPLITSTLYGTVLRAGEKRRVIWYPYPTKDRSRWKKFNAMIESADRPKFRICYCSAFNQCWRTDGVQLNPPRVAACPVPKVPFTG